MRGFIRGALVPVLRVWAAVSERAFEAIPRPADAPQAHSAGIDSDRVLLLGSGPAVGWGVFSHDLALGELRHRPDAPAATARERL